MALRVLIMPDKFKGTLTAQQAAQALARGWGSARPEDRLTLLPMSDGGDGFGQVLSDLMGGEPRAAKAVDAAHRPCEAVWWHDPRSGTAIVESAQVIGLAMLPAGKYHPFELDTQGLGQVLKAAAEAGARRCVVGIGGSATNDAGMGMARALGWQFQNHRGAFLERWTDLHAVAQVHRPEKPPLFDQVTVAVDVQNPLLGEQGCSRVYGPQKGLGPEDFEFAERCLGRLADVMRHDPRLDHDRTPGAGAAGGLGFGLMSFCGARLEGGFQLFAHHAGLAERLRDVDLVLTGEGAIDEQTLMGKGVGEVAALCRRAGVACAGFGGRVIAPDKTESPFTTVHALSPDWAPPAEAMQRPAEVLEALAAHTARGWKA